MGTALQHFTLVVPSAPAVVEALRREGKGDLVVEELAAVIPVRSTAGSKQVPLNTTPFPPCFNPMQPLEQTAIGLLYCNVAMKRGKTADGGEISWRMNAVGGDLKPGALVLTLLWSCPATAGEGCAPSTGQGHEAQALSRPLMTHPSA